MKTALVPVRIKRGPDLVEDALVALNHAWRQGTPTFDDFAQLAVLAQSSPSLVARLIKTDLNHRYTHGQKLEVAAYLDRFPEIAANKDRVVSLLYEEFCLREEFGEPQDPSAFCARYPVWGDSIRSQIRYHRVISQAVGNVSTRPVFPEPGDMFARFELARVLGRGGAARVYLAFDDKLGGKPFALKISADIGEEPSIMGRLSHPNIVPVYSVETEAGTGLRGLVMPYLPGLPLDQVIKRIDPTRQTSSALGLWQAVAPRSKPGEPAPPATPPWLGFPSCGTYAQGVAWLIQVLAQALEHAHSHEIEHGDVKPANILLTVDQGPQLLDFNLARSPEIVNAAHKGGTLPYMAPEQLRAFLDPERWDEVGAQADIYSLGLVMVELITGIRPEIDEPLEKLPLTRAITDLLLTRESPRPSIQRAKQRIPHALEAIVDGCLAFNSTDRYASAADLAEDLGRFINRQPLVHASNPSRVERSVNVVHRKRRPLLIGLAVVVSLVLAGPWLGLYERVVALTQLIEQRSELRQAVADLDAGKVEIARSAFIQLQSSYPHSILPDLYLASIQAGSKTTDFGFLEKSVQKVMRTKDRLEQIKRGDLIDSKLCRTVAKIAEALRADPNVREPQDEEMAWGLAGLVEALNPDEPLVLGLLAARSIKRKDYGTAADQLDRALEFARTKDDRRQLLQSRARLRIIWGQDLLANPSKPSPQEAVAKFQGALDDMKTYRTYIVDQGGVNFFTYLMMTSRTLIGLARSSSRDPSSTAHSEKFYLEQAKQLVTDARLLEVAIWNNDQHLADGLWDELQNFTHATSD